jgi:hypothetical protein
LEGGHRLVVEHFSRLGEARLVLRPARKRLFATEPFVPSLQVELNKPAFAALVHHNCPDGLPLMVFETDAISAGIRELYRAADIPVVEADQSGGRGLLRFERPGFSAKLQFDDRGDAQAVESIMRWAETASLALKGCLIRNAVERCVLMALGSFADEMGIAIHHQVPFGYAVGYRPDLPKAIARHTVEMTVSLRPDQVPGAPVVMPIRIETEADERKDADAVEKDQGIADYVCSVGMPMAAIQPGEGGRYRVTYSLECAEDVQLEPDDQKGWEKAMREITAHAVGVTRAGLEKPSDVG